jgi:hypothetical protein
MLRLMVFIATFNNISVIYFVAVSFIGGGNRSTRRKTTVLPLVIDKFYHIMLYRVHPSWVGFELTTLVVIGTVFLNSCISNYHTITNKTTFLRMAVWVFIHLNLFLLSCVVATLYVYMSYLLHKCKKMIGLAWTRGRPV